MQAGLLYDMVLGYQNERGHVRRLMVWRTGLRPFVLLRECHTKQCLNPLSAILFWNKDENFINFMQYILIIIK